MEIVIKLDRLKLPKASESPSKNFFQDISDKTGAVVFWESGSKTFPGSKEPCIKINGTEESVQQAKNMVLEKLEVQSNRVVMKLEVTHLEHPSLIGKGGSLINKVMKATGCQIHFPDENVVPKKKYSRQRSPVPNIHFPDVNKPFRKEKINRVSINGDPVNVERARVMIRALIPIQIHFEVRTTHIFNSQILNSVHPNYDCTLPEAKFLGTYHGLLLYSASRENNKIYIVRCNQDQFSYLRKDITMLMENICGTKGLNLPPVHMIMDIMRDQHEFVKGPNNSNVDGIVKRTGAEIIFPVKDSHKPEERSITISGSLDSVYVAWLEIMNYLPVTVSFDVNNTRETEGEYMDFLRDLGIASKSRDHPRYSIKNVTLKGPEKYSKQMLQYRQHLLRLPNLRFWPEIKAINLASDFLKDLNEQFWNAPAHTIPSSVRSMTSKNLGYKTLQLNQNGTASHSKVRNNSVFPVITNGRIINESQIVETGHYYMATTEDFKIQTHPLLLALEQSKTSGCYWQSKMGENSNSNDQLLLNNNWIKNIPFENGSSGFSEMTQSLAEQSVCENSGLPQSLFMDNQNGETTLAEDYYQKKVLAARAMRRPIESTQVPTSLWAGYGFSQSMPAVKHYNHYQFSDSSSEDLEKSWEKMMKNLDIWSNKKESKLSHSNYFDFLRMRLPFDANKQTKDILPDLLWKHGLHQHIDTFTKQEIDFQAFLMLTDHDLQIMGIAHQARVKLVCLIRELQEKYKTDAALGEEISF